MSDNYTDIEDVIRNLWEFKEADTTIFEPMIERASRIFDILCYVPAGHFLDKSLNAENRVIYGSGSVYLLLPDHYEPVVSVTMPSGYTVPHYIELDGHLKTTDADGVIFHSLHSGKTVWADGVPITVSAKWGYASVPADVKEAVVELTVAMFRSKDQAFLKAVNLETNQVLVNAIPERTKLVAGFYNSRKEIPAFV